MAICANIVSEYNISLTELKNMDIDELKEWERMSIEKAEKRK